MQRSNGTPQGRRTLPFVLLALLALLVAGGWIVRDYSGIELSTESVRGIVHELGWKAPVLFLGLVTFRNFLLLPAAVVLPVGGLCFGAATGTFLGALGILLSALMKFGIARGIQRSWKRPGPGDTLAGIQRRIERAGPLLIGLATAHPLGPMSPLHWAAGLSTIPVLAFTIAVAIGGPLRAATYSYLGSTLADLRSTEFYIATALLAVAIVLPLAHPGFRQIMFSKPVLPGTGPIDLEPTDQNRRPGEKDAP